jgi:hypothetical protein
VGTALAGGRALSGRVSPEFARLLAGVRRASGRAFEDPAKRAAGTEIRPAGHRVSYQDPDEEWFHDDDPKRPTGAVPPARRGRRLIPAMGANGARRRGSARTFPPRAGRRRRASGARAGGTSGCGWS